MKLIPLRIEADSSELEDYASEALDDVIPDAVVRKFRTDGGFVLATIWRDSVHKVVYQTPLRFFWSRRKRNRELFNYYGDGQTWSEDWPVDFGESRKREDGQVRALYSKIKDYVTFVTTEFDSHRSDKRWEGKLD